MNSGFRPKLQSDGGSWDSEKSPGINNFFKDYPHLDSTMAGQRLGRDRVWCDWLDRTKCGYRCGKSERFGFDFEIKEFGKQIGMGSEEGGVILPVEVEELT